MTHRHAPGGELPKSCKHTNSLNPNKLPCKKKFPKPVINRTHIGKGGYPEYQRSETDKFVVPYNPYFNKEIRLSFKY